ncbi:hypothetical protein AB0M54_24615 [Actinoplanes sp. NPDC051470]|uniref:hypothetical protein n=1 Tax=Actinoplanes sp. NPDC051470 TaxID=3157224 RepID=UPI00341AFCC3
MTSQPETRSVLQLLRPLRDIAAWALVGLPAVLIFVSIIDLIPFGDGDTFTTRTQASFYDFINLATIFLPLAAVLLALLVEPRHPKAQLITIIALAEYAAAAFFGVIFGFLVGLINIAGFSVQSALQELLARAAWLGLLAVAGWAMYNVWRGLFHVAKPKPQPGMYGQPAYGVPGTYPGQPGYGQAPGPYHPGQPTQPQPGQPQPTWNQQPPSHGQPPAGYGQPPAWGQPSSGPPAPGTYGGPPVSGAPGSFPPPSSAPPSPFNPPASGGPSFPPPSSGGPSFPPPPPPAPGQAFAEPTQAVPRPGQSPGSYGQPTSSPPAPQSPAAPDPSSDDRTQIVGNDRPGFGPANQDPPRS